MPLKAMITQKTNFDPKPKRRPTKTNVPGLCLQSDDDSKKPEKTIS